jgi:hypothetical protein
MSDFRTSRCETPNDPPLSWHFYVDDAGHSPLTDEILACFNGLVGSARIARYTAISQRLNAAARGALTWPEELKPVVRDPELWEIRWGFDDEQWRMYHGEPAQAPGWLISLRFHQKDTRGKQGEQREAQNQEMNVATLRFIEGRPRQWGLP